MRATWSLLLPCLFATACEPRAPTLPPPIPSSSASSPSSPAQPRLAPGLPAFADACAKDADCDVTDRYLDGSSVCCASCTRVAASRTWTAALHAHCNTRRPAECPSLDCPNDASKPACVSGRCALR